MYPGENVACSSLALPGFGTRQHPHPYPIHFHPLSKRLQWQRYVSLTGRARIMFLFNLRMHHDF